MANVLVISMALKPELQKQRATKIPNSNPLRALIKLQLLYSNIFTTVILEVRWNFIILFKLNFN